jgi:hypothetical protein
MLPYSSSSPFLCSSSFHTRFVVMNSFISCGCAGPHHTRLLPPLLEKLGDSKIVLRQMVTSVLMQLMQVIW